MITIAHRGASSVAPENTLAAFKEAVGKGADMIELDVRLSSDGAVVVFHDLELTRTTDGSGPVEDLTLAELKRLDAGSWFSERFRGERIPTLEEAIQAISSSRIELCIEIKIDKGREELRRELVYGTIDILDRTCFRDRAVMASFDREAIRVSRAARPEIRAGLIFNKDEVWAECAEESYAGLDFLSARWNIITAERVAKAHRVGRKVIAWTVDRNEELSRVLPLSVDAVASNNPEWLIKAIKD